MDSNEELVRRMRAGNFVENNGRVMRALNLLGNGSYLHLKNLRNGLSDFTEQDFIEAINYLQLKGYILLRGISSRRVIDVADAEYTAMETKLSATGIDLMQGFVADKAVGV